MDSLPGNPNTFADQHKHKNEVWVSDDPATFGMDQSPMLFHSYFLTGIISNNSLRGSTGVPIMM